MAIELLKVPQPAVDDTAEKTGGKFPMHVHSEDGETFKEVRNEDELAAAVKDGWLRVDVDPETNKPAAEGASPKKAAAPKKAATRKK